jgi:hypothetical protein
MQIRHPRIEHLALRAIEHGGPVAAELEPLRVGDTRIQKRGHNPAKALQTVGVEVSLS